MTEKEAYILKWIQKNDKFSVCESASCSNLKIIESDIGNITPIKGFDVAIFIVQQKYSLYALMTWCDILRRRYPGWSFYEDCQFCSSFNGKYNLIICKNDDK